MTSVLNTSDPSPLLRPLTILGAGLSIGQPHPGVESAPETMRRHGLLSVIENLSTWQVNDAGDLDFDKELPVCSLTPGQINNVLEAAYATRKIAEATEAIARRGDFCLTLGGDHSMAAGSIYGLLKAIPDLSVIWVDAHGDFNTPLTSPSGNFHGMPVAALTGVFDLSAYPGFEYYQALLPPERIALVGVRSLDREERELLQQKGILVFTMSEIDRYGIGKVMQAALKRVNPMGVNRLHLSFDIDALDPAIAPSTGTKVPGGLTYREAHYIAEAMAETGMLVSMDVVEVNPALRPDGSFDETTTADPTVLMAIELIESALGKRIAPSLLIEDFIQ